MTYTNLLNHHVMRPVENTIGRPYVIQDGHLSKWYVDVELNPETRKRYFIGIGLSEMHANSICNQAGAAKEKGKSSSLNSIVERLISSGYPSIEESTGELIKELSEAGVFRLGGVLVGGQAFRMYASVLACPNSDISRWPTNDIDIAGFQLLSQKVGDFVTRPIPAILDSLSVHAVPNLHRGRPTKWRAADGSVSIDFISPSFVEAESPQFLKALGVWAQGMHHLNFLLREPIDAVALRGEGVFVKIPAPARFAVHKLITSHRRPDKNSKKARNDIAQSIVLIDKLKEMDPGALQSAFQEAMAIGPAWRRAINSSLDSSSTLRSTLSQIVDQRILK